MGRNGSFTVSRRLVGLVFFVLGMISTNHVLAAKPGASRSDSRIPTLLELRTLPPYCGPRIGELLTANYPPEFVAANAPAAKMWKERFGINDYSHLHHYCFALNYMNRARFASNRNSKKTYLGMALQDFDYVLNRWKPGFPLYAQAKVYRSQAEMLRSLASGP